MQKQELKQYVDKFGYITGGKKGYKKTFPGIIAHIDVLGSVYFVDNDGVGTQFKPNEVDGFEEKEFTEAPQEIRGRKIINLGGQFVYADTKKDVDLKK